MFCNFNNRSTVQHKYVNMYSYSCTCEALAIRLTFERTRWILKFRKTITNRVHGLCAKQTRFRKIHLVFLFTRRHSVCRTRWFFSGDSLTARRFRPLSFSPRCLASFYAVDCCGYDHGWNFIALLLYSFSGQLHDAHFVKNCFISCQTDILNKVWCFVMYS